MTTTTTMTVMTWASKKEQGTEMNREYNLIQKEKREIQNQIRTTIRLPNSMILQLKIRAFEQKVRTNTYIIKILELATETVMANQEEITELRQAEDYDELRPVQVILPKKLLSKVQILGIILKEKDYYQDKVPGITAKGRSIIDLLQTGLLLDTEQ